MTVKNVTVQSVSPAETAKLLRDGLDLMVDTLKISDEAKPLAKAMMKLAFVIYIQPTGVLKDVILSSAVESFFEHSQAKDLMRQIADKKVI